MNSKSVVFKRYLYAAVSLAYVGEYNALIAILEHARQLGGSEYAVLFYLVYCIPAVLLLILSSIWGRLFDQSKKYLPFVYVIGAFVILTFSNSTQASIVTLCVFVIAFFRQWTRSLILSLIQEYFSGAERDSVTSQIISLRFVVMIVGATIGGYLGERQMFSVSLYVNALSYFVSGVLLACGVRFLGQSINKSFIENDGPLLFYKRIFEGFKGLLNSMGTRFLALVLITSLGVNAFMALEYPILVTELGVAPSSLFIVYLGHIFGAILAGRFNVTSWADKNIHLRSLALAALLCFSYAFIGIGSTHMFWISTQLGLCAFLLPIFETLYSTHLMANAKSGYYAQNLSLNFFIEISNLVGSALPLLLIGGTTAVSANRVLQGVVILVILLMAITLKSNFKFKWNN